MENLSKPAPFSFATVEGFDNHIESSIPGFAYLVDMVVGLAGYYVDHGARVLDLGCSTGALLNRLNTKFERLELDLVGYDCEPNLLGRLATPAPKLSFVEQDITRPEFGIEPGAALVTSIFTLQFLPEASRPALLHKVYQALRPGGALIVAEKIHQESGQLQEQFCFAGYDFKRRSFSAEAILSKQQDLRHIMRPLSEAHNVAQLRQAGFTTIVPFWQGLLFKAWVCIK